MSDNPVQDVLNELFPYFERLEAQSAAVLQLLVEKGIVSNDELERYLSQASTASDIKWRAARVRMARLMTPPTGDYEKKPKSGESQASGPSQDKPQETPENLAKAPGASETTSEQPEPTPDSAPGQTVSVANNKTDLPHGETEHKKSGDLPRQRRAESSNTPAEHAEGPQSKNAA
jgi:hypothetical protein